MTHLTLTVEHPYEVTFKTDSIQAAIPIVERPAPKRQAIYQVQAIQTMQTCQKLKELL